MPKEPEPSIEWEVTTRCNYHCSYCNAIDPTGKTNRHCSDELTEAVFKLLGELPGQWSVKLIGGEPQVHPRFLEICERIAEAGHNVVMTTNLSLPLPRLRKMVEVTGDKLSALTASLHLEQVPSVDQFIEKAIEFNKFKHPSTLFVVTSVCLEEKWDELKGIADRFRAAGVRFAFQALRVDGKFVEYSNPEIEQAISERFLENTDKIRGMNLYGTYCHTGELFFRINVDGNVVRCYVPQPLYFLGNLTQGTFKRLPKAMPCLADRCTCTLPANRGMIKYQEKASKLEIAMAQAEALLRNAQRRVAERIPLIEG